MEQHTLLQLVRLAQVVQELLESITIQVEEDSEAFLQ
tara:strand:- start:294 stop:404 length:111 start_codon:yes stop_codon:yes gene_type:complete